MDRSRKKIWNFEEDCEQIGTNESSSSDEFEVVPVKPISEFKLVPEQKVQCFDEDELEIHENHFLFGNNETNDSDSEIEVVDKSSSRSVGKPLYAQVLQKNIDQALADASFEQCHADEENDIDLTAEEVTDDAAAADDDSEIEVIRSGTNDEEDSLEIIFSNDAQEPEKCSMAFSEQESSDFEDYGISSLFEVTLEDKHEMKEKFISVKTSTLIIVFCACVLSGIMMGSGFGSLLINVLQSNTDVSREKVVIPPEFYLLSERQHFNVTSICSSSNMKRNLKVLLTSHRKLEEEHETLKALMEELQDRYHMQTQMTMYWKKQAKKHTVHNDHPVPRVFDGLMHFEANKKSSESASLEGNLIIQDLKKKLQKEKQTSHFWKERYSSIKLSKMRKCARWGKLLPTSNFSFSACLSMFSNALPELNISSKLPNLTKPVGKIADHVHRAWHKFKSGWHKTGQEMRQRNKDRFRKMLKISNVINLFREKNAYETTSTNTDQSYCPDEAYRKFQERWRRHTEVNRPKPTVDNISYDLKREQHDVLKSDASKEEANVYLFKPSPSLRKKNKIKGPVKPGKNQNRKGEKMRQISPGKKVEYRTAAEAGEWYKKQLRGLNFQFDVYKWEIIGKIEKMEQSMKIKVEEEEKKNEKKTKSVLKKEKVKYQKKVAKLKKKLKENGSRVSKWLFNEKIDMKHQIRMLKKKLKKQKGDYRTKIRRVKKLVMAHLKKEYNKLKRGKLELNDMKKEWREKIAQYKKSDQRYKEDLKNLRKEYEELKEKYFSQFGTEDYTDNESDETPKWRFPMVYCPDQQNCATETLKNYHSTFTETVATAFQDFPAMAEHKSNAMPWMPSPPRKFMKKCQEPPLDFTPVPSKPQPPLPFTCSKDKEKDTNKLFLFASKPVPPSRVRHLYQNASFAETEKAVPLRWLHYWRKEDIETFDKHDQSSTIPLDWYITWMQSRESLRKRKSEQMSESELNWFIQMMRNREEQRDQYIPMNWYLKWMEGRQKRKEV